MSNARSGSDQVRLAARGHSIYSFRAQRGVSQEELGFDCHLDRIYISGIDLGYGIGLSWSCDVWHILLHTALDAALQASSRKRRSRARQSSQHEVCVGRVGGF